MLRVPIFPLKFKVRGPEKAAKLVAKVFETGRQPRFNGAFGGT